jgi:hypothetical protein
MGVPYYVKVGGSDSADGLTWATAKATITGAYNVMVNVDDVCYVGHNVVDATTGWALDGGLAFVSIDATLMPGTLSARAGASSTANVPNGTGYVEGIYFSRTTAANLVFAATRTKFKSCQITANASNNVAAAITVGKSTQGMHLEFVDTDFKFTGAAQSISLSNPRMIVMGGSVSTTAGKHACLLSMLGGSSTLHVDILFDGVDFTGFDATSLLNATFPASGTVVFRRCKFNASFAGVLSSGGVSSDAFQVLMLECDVAGVAPTYRYELDTRCGTIKAGTSTYRVGGASISGFNVAWNVAITTFQPPLAMCTPDLTAYNENITSPVSVTIEFLAQKSNLMAYEAWLEISYLVDATSSKGAFATSYPASYVSRNVAVQSSSATWVGTPAGYYPYKITLTMSPKQIGALTAQLKMAGAFGFIVDPYLTVA